jgi:hypothetical protein
MGQEYRNKVRACQIIHERARQLRGGFLNSTAVIEHEIAAFLTSYFCTNDDVKRELFFAEVAAAMPLGKKRALLTAIIKQDYPRFWDEDGDPIRDLRELQGFRNKLAHSMIDVSEKALARPIKEGIGFIQWNNGEPITEAEFNNWDARAVTTYATIRDLRQMLPYKETARG